MVPPGKGYHGSKLQLSGAVLTLMSGHNESLAEIDGSNNGLAPCILGLILAEGLSSQFSSLGQQSQKRQDQEQTEEERVRERKVKKKREETTTIENNLLLLCDLASEIIIAVLVFELECIIITLFPMSNLQSYSPSQF